MTEYLLDTNHISPIVTLEHPLREHILARLADNDTFSIATPALSEFLFGIISLPRAKRNRAEWEHLKTRFNYYSIDRFDAEHAAELRLMLRKQGWQLAALDALIAVVALRYELVLLTTDKDFDAIPNLKTENWRDYPR
ncbi:type II toxin-antitoxin system VapC family toxin [Anaerolineales bacterium HSG6]|nr:type II toxin-antitoxin system VapC family toxin [Anaerolineales bacterium HSG6]